METSSSSKNKLQWIQATEYYATIKNLIAAEFNDMGM